MLFIPLIENAYKHSSAKEGENIINIAVAIDEKSLYFAIDNACDIPGKQTANDAGGLGLTLVRRRLELIYPGNHTMDISQDKSRYRVELALLLDEY
jgi:two-component system LytT family sensor kinase